jgi:hypothetical protein
MDSVEENDMLTKKSIGIAVVCALALGASGAALATPITVGGVTWDPASGFDLNINALNLRETSVSAVGDVLHGYGQIGSINSNNGFCVGTGGAGCDLTFQFTYTVQSLGLGGSGNPQAIFTNGTIQFYVNPKDSYNMQFPTSAGPGTPWLTLTGHTGALTGFTGTGQLFSNINGTVSDPTSGSNGNGYLDATGGPAMKHVDSHTISDGMGGWADFSINSSFLEQIFKGCGSTPSTDLDNVCAYPIQGTGNLIGSSVKVPEPSEIGLLGLGLGALGLLLRRRRKEAQE